MPKSEVKVYAKDGKIVLDIGMGGIVMDLQDAQTLAATLVQCSREAAAQGQLALHSKLSGMG